MHYESPVLHLQDESVENEFLGAVAALLGVSVAFVSFVCNACGWENCRSFWSTVGTVRAWFGSGC